MGRFKLNRKNWSKKLAAKMQLAQACLANLFLLSYASEGTLRQVVEEQSTCTLNFGVVLDADNCPQSFHCEHNGLTLEPFTDYQDQENCQWIRCDCTLQPPIFKCLPRVGCKYIHKGCSKFLFRVPQVQNQCLFNGCVSVGED